MQRKGLLDGLFFEKEDQSDLEEVENVLELEDIYDEEKVREWLEDNYMYSKGDTIIKTDVYEEYVNMVNLHLSDVSIDIKRLSIIIGKCFKNSKKFYCTRY